MEKTFTNAIIHNKVLAPHQAGQLVLFMMDHADELLQCPDAVEEMVLARLDDLRGPQLSYKKRKFGTFKISYFSASRFHSIL